MEINIRTNELKKYYSHISIWVLVAFLSIISIFNFYKYYSNGLGLAYNDARSHLDIGRRVVEGLKPGMAQLGSVWLPLNHVLMIPTIWNNFMWHSGLSGSIQSMVSFVITGVLIYKFIERLKVGVLGRLTGVAVFITNINILYMQSTAMTELLLLATMTAGCYFLLVWHQSGKLTDLIISSLFIMLSTLVRYDGWFLLMYSLALIAINVWRKHNFKQAEGTSFLFLTLGAFGIVLWVLWNTVIFKDPLYFAFGPYSAHAQQAQLQSAGVLATERNLPLSLSIYLHALLYNAYTLPALLAFAGVILLFFDKKLDASVRLSVSSLLAPLIFNIIALYMGFSVLFVQGLSGDTWFNIRYGIMLLPSIAIFVGYLVGRLKGLRPLIIGSLVFVLLFAMVNQDAVTIDDARVGSSQKNVSEVSDWLKVHAANEPGYILISVASHDAIIFSSGLPMSRFIHEGTGLYWESAIQMPDRWARWIIMRTYDKTDQTWKLVSKSPGLAYYTKVGSYPFADIYELDSKYLSHLNTSPVFSGQKN